MICPRTGVCDRSCMRHANASARRAAKILDELDVEHARHRLDGAGDLRRDLEASRQPDLDLGAAAELKHHADFAVRDAL